MLNEIALRMLAAWQTFCSNTRDEEGQTLAEYGLIMAVIAVAVIVLAGVAFRGAIVDSFTSSTNCLSGLGSCAY
jgi:Flp pilus assembly pilin Flp